MKTIVIENTTVINESSVDVLTPMFAVLNGCVQGMIVGEQLGWILKIGGKRGSTGYYATRKNCIKDAIKAGYQICIDCEVK